MKRLEVCIRISQGCLHIVLLQTIWDWWPKIPYFYMFKIFFMLQGGVEAAFYKTFHLDHTIKAQGFTISGCHVLVHLLIAIVDIEENSEYILFSQPESFAKNFLLRTFRLTGPEMTSYMSHGHT